MRIPRPRRPRLRRPGKKTVGGFTLLVLAGLAAGNIQRIRRATAHMRNR